jgi:hypothetical protein
VGVRSRISSGVGRPSASTCIWLQSGTMTTVVAIASEKCSTAMRAKWGRGDRRQGGGIAYLRQVKSNLQEQRVRAAVRTGGDRSLVIDLGWRNNGHRQANGPRLTCSKDVMKWNHAGLHTTGPTVSELLRPASRIGQRRGRFDLHSCVRGAGKNGVSLADVWSKCETEEGFALGLFVYRLLRSSVRSRGSPPSMKRRAPSV